MTRSCWTKKWCSQKPGARLLQPIAYILLIAVFGHLSASAQDCSAITKFGIFDVRRTSQQIDIVDDLIKWLSVNEYKTESDARSASARAGFVIPGIDIPLNVDGTYGEKHSSTWTKATLDFLQTHQEYHSKFSQEFVTANPVIAAAWQACVTKATGLVCWAKQTDKQDEVLLNLEVRPITLPLSSPIIKSIVVSPNLKPLSSGVKKPLNVNVTSLLFTRVGGAAKDAANFTVDTDNTQYRCSADVPSLPPPAPVWQAVTTESTFLCQVGRNDFTGEGPKIGDKHLFGVHCHAPNPITKVDYLGCFDSADNRNGGACPWLDRHAEYDLPTGPYPKGTDVNLRFATNSGDPLVVKFDITYSTTTQKCVKNCDWKLHDMISNSSLHMN